MKTVLRTEIIVRFTSTTWSTRNLKPQSATIFSVMLNEFRNAYPTGSLISELLDIYQGKYLVRVLVIVDRITLATGLAAEDTLETAEDRARLRALSALNLDSKQTPLASDAMLSQQGAAGWSPRDTESMARSRPQDLVTSRIETSTSDLPRDYAASEIPTSSDQWLSSRQTNPPESKPSDSGEAIASWSNQPKSFETFETDSSFSGVTTNLPSPGVGTKTEPINPSEFESPPNRVAQAMSSLDPSEESLSDKNLLDAEERKTKIAETTIEIQRLNWTTQQGRDFLQQRYNRRARSQLTDEQLLDFLHYLKAQPTPS
jgi:hypothetical protein